MGGFVGNVVAWAKAKAMVGWGALGRAHGPWSSKRGQRCLAAQGHTCKLITNGYFVGILFFYF